MFCKKYKEKARKLKEQMEVAKNLVKTQNDIIAELGNEINDLEKFNKDKDKNILKKSPQVIYYATKNYQVILSEFLSCSGKPNRCKV